MRGYRVSGIKKEFKLNPVFAMEFDSGCGLRNCSAVEEVGGGDNSVEVSASSTTISRRTMSQYTRTCLPR